MNNTPPNQLPYPNRTSRYFSLDEELMLHILIRWGVMGGGWVYGAMPTKAVQVIWIYNGFSHLVEKYL
jgi:hypothetical protein